DLNAMKVLRVEDTGVVPLPPEPGNYTRDDIAEFSPTGEYRKGLMPLEITQPDGASFSVQGHFIQWQKWSFRIGFTPREGLVLYTIGYEDGGRVRPILYRAALSELFIPYGDPHPTHYRKHVFDMGEYGIGKLANSLALGCDCLGEIRYFDGVVNDSDGEPVTIHNAICL